MRSVFNIFEIVHAHVRLVTNIDQTPLPLFLVSKYTTNKKNEPSISISHSADYQITGTFSITLSGKFLPPQLIYQVKTNRCHPKYDFPKELNISHSDNHWSNTKLSMELVKTVLLSYVNRVKEEKNVRSSKEWLLLADVFKAQWTDDVKQKITENHGKIVPLPNNMTSYFQPLDLTVNRSCKHF